MVFDISFGGICVLHGPIGVGARDFCHRGGRGAALLDPRVAIKCVRVDRSCRCILIVDCHSLVNDLDLCNNCEAKASVASPHFPRKNMQTQ